MATEAKGNESAGLVRRVGKTAATLFDDQASTADRVKAGTTVIGGGAAAIGGTLAAGDAVNVFLLNNSTLMDGLHSAVASTGGIGAAVGAGAGLLTYGVTWFASEEPSDGSHSDRNRAHGMVGKIRVGSVVVAGVAGLLALGVDITDTAQLTQAAGFDHALVGTFAAAVGAAGGLSAARMITRIGIDKPQKAQAQLGE